jgi:hypothetical protein
LPSIPPVAQSLSPKINQLTKNTATKFLRQIDPLIWVCFVRPDYIRKSTNQTADERAEKPESQTRWLFAMMTQIIGTELYGGILTIAE